MKGLDVELRYTVMYMAQGNIRKTPEEMTLPTSKLFSKIFFLLLLSLLLKSRLVCVEP